MENAPPAGESSATTALRRFALALEEGESRALCNIKSVANSGLKRLTSKKSKINILRAQHLGALPWLVHGFSTRVDGFSRVYGGQSLNLGFTKDDSHNAVERNRISFLQE